MPRRSPSSTRRNDAIAPRRVWDFTGEGRFVDVPARLTPRHNDLPAVKAARAAAAAWQAKWQGRSHEYLGRGNFGLAYKLERPEGDRVLKFPVDASIHFRPYRREEQTQNLMAEAGIANELREAGFGIVPEIVYVELDDGTPILVREYGEPVTAKNPPTEAEVDALEAELLAIDRSGWSVLDDLAIYRRPDRSLFVGDVGFWKAPRGPRPGEKPWRWRRMDSYVPHLFDRWLREVWGEERTADFSTRDATESAAEAVAVYREDGLTANLYRKALEALAEHRADRAARGLPDPTQGRIPRREDTYENAPKALPGQLDLFAAVRPPPAVAPEPPPAAPRAPVLRPVAPSPAPTLARPPAAPRMPDARGLRWPDLQAVKNKQVVTVMSGDGVVHYVDALASWQRSVRWPEAPPVDAAGRPFEWPELLDVEVLRALVAAGALIVANDSGGKDSQALVALLGRVVPRNQLVVAHAILPGVEWEGTTEHARSHAAALGVPFLTAQAGKTFLDMVDRNMARHDAVPWPSPEYRQCTSDLKRGPLERVVRAYAEQHGFRIIVDAEGLRALESPKRRLQPVWGFNKSKSLLPDRAGRRAGGDDRLWVKYRGIHHLTARQVFDVIEAAGQTPHPAYYAGNARLSCVFCIMGKRGDLRRGALHNPEMYGQLVEREERSGYTMNMGRKPLVELTGLTVEEAHRQRRSLPVVTGPFRGAIQEGTEEDGDDDPCDEWAPDEGDEEPSTALNGVPCARHAHLGAAAWAAADREARLRVIFAQERATFARTFPGLARAELVVVESLCPPSTPACRPRDVAECVVGERPRVTLVGRLGGAHEDTIRGVIRHELGHAASWWETRAGRRPRRGTGAEQWADDLAEHATGDRVRYDREALQTIGAGVYPRPAWLHR